MIDAYDVQQALRLFWGKLAVPSSAADIKKSFPTIPVYVKIDGKLVPVTNVSLNENKIVLDITNE